MSGSQNALAVLSQGGIPAAFRARTDLPNMHEAAQQGLLGSFGIIGFKNSKWWLKFRGEETLLTNERGEPQMSMDIVIVGISPNITKLYYEKAYSDGDDNPPDCYSMNGIVPEPNSPKLQCATCAACPQNVFGSKITNAGKKAKACNDSRQLAVVPWGDILNEDYGGPMLLRIPTMSLANLATYTTELARYSAQPYMVHTVLGFDHTASYPLLTFKPAGWLDDSDTQDVLTTMQSPAIDRMLAYSRDDATRATAPQTPNPTSVAQPPSPVQPQAATPVAPQPTPAPTPSPEPVAQVQTQPAPVATAANPGVSPEIAAAMEVLRRAQASTAQATAQAPQPEQAQATSTPAPTPPAAPKKGFGTKKTAAPAMTAPPADAQVGGPAVTSAATQALPTAPEDLAATIDAILNGNS